MTKGSRVATAAVPKKVLARVASVGLSSTADGILADCFRQYGIQVVGLSGDPVQRLHREKFDACALRLDEHAEPILEAARTSRSNWQMVIYGICRTAQEALRYSRYSINAVFDWPVERQNALRVVRATHLLVLHEFRRYVRIPIVADIRMKAEGTEFRGMTHELSAGGLSLSCKHKLSTGQPASVSFELPGMAAQVNIRGTVCWTRPAEGLAGFRFDAADEARFHVRQWIDDFIDNA